METALVYSDEENVREIERVKPESALYWLSYLELLVLTHSSDKADLTNGWHRSCRFNILYVR